MSRAFMAVVVATGAVLASGCSDRTASTSPSALPLAEGGRPAGSLRITRSDPSSELTEGPVARIGASSDAGAPTVIFKVRPAPTQEGVIVGSAPFDVEFNVCRSSDSDGDPLLFTMDADGDGTLDEAGTHGGNCRRTFTYTADRGAIRELKPRICVVDVDTLGHPKREPECRTYAVRVIGPPPEVPATCAAPAPGVTGWLATGASTQERYKCSVDGTEASIFEYFVPSCFANGGRSARWTSGGACECMPPWR